MTKQLTGILKMILNEEESQAAKEAHQKGYTSAGWGRWKDKTGNIVAITKGNKLVPVQYDDKQNSTKEKIGFPSSLKGLDKYDKHEMIKSYNISNDSKEIKVDDKDFDKYKKDDSYVLVYKRDGQPFAYSRGGYTHELRGTWKHIKDFDRQDLRWWPKEIFKNRKQLKNASHEVYAIKIGDPSIQNKIKKREDYKKNIPDQRQKTKEEKYQDLGYKYTKKYNEDIQNKLKQLMNKIDSLPNDEIKDYWKLYNYISDADFNLKFKSRSKEDLLSNIEKYKKALSINLNQQQTSGQQQKVSSPTTKKVTKKRAKKQ